METERNLLFITGHSRGLGAALTASGLAKGFQVLGLSRGHWVQTDPHLEQISIDLGHPQALEGVLDGLAHRGSLTGFQRIWLINSAGLLGPIHRVGGQAPSEIAQAVTVNLQALLTLTNWFVSQTQGLPDRRVVHVSSGAARSPYVGWSIYCATKAAVDHYARCLALEAQAEGPSMGLRVCSLAPGVIDTDMQAEVRASSPTEFPNRPRFEALKETGGLATPHAVAEQLLAYMGSEAFGTEPCADLRSLNR